MDFFSGFSFSIFQLLTLANLGVKCYMVENDTTAMMYLQRFGYIEADDMSPYMGMKEAQPMLVAFQKMCGIDQTGELDYPTVDMMNAPRCGNKDMMRIPVNESEVDGYLSSNRLKRYVLNQHKLKWKKRDLTYKMGAFSQEMHKHVTPKDVLAAVQKAFKLWSTVTNLDFFHEPKAKHVDIELTFTSRFHPQDGYPFDGPGQVLAHAFPPGESSLAGDVHFEDEETWHVNSPKGTDVLFVAVHEIGHSLGLSHSSTKGAIMAAFYGGYKPKLSLHPDDIDGIQALYGKREVRMRDEPPPPQHKPKPKVLPPKTTTTQRTTTTRKTTTTTRRPPPPRTTTTTTTTPRTTFYTRLPPIVYETTKISNRLYPWKSKEPTKPPKIPFFERPDLCSDGKINAITSMNDGKIYVFKGSYVFQISPSGEGVLPGWPNHIGYIFPGLDPDIDAATTRENGKTYIFKGNVYWRFSKKEGSIWIMDIGYPKPISQHFPGIPGHLNAAFAWFGQFYFTKGDKFWRFDPIMKPHVNSIYPLSTDIWGLENGLDAAFTAPNGAVYFFKDSLYYRLDPATFKIAKKSPPYPLSSTKNWFGCKIKRADSRNIRKLLSPPLNNDYEDGIDY